MVDRDRVAREYFERFGIPKIAYGVDGMHAKFVGMPRDRPAHIPPQRFWNRKQCYSLSVQVISNSERICAVDVGWPGSAHDSRIWTRSLERLIVEADPSHRICGDSAYPISAVMVKPYPARETRNNRENRIFNKKLSQIRTLMTEDVFGQWQRMFPYITNMRTHLKTSQKIIVATAILFNIRKEMRDSDEFNRLDWGLDRVGLNPQVYVLDLEMRRVGQARGDELRNMMVIKLNFLCIFYVFYINHCKITMCQTFN